MRIDSHQLAIVVGVAIAGARRPRLDVANHSASIAADLVIDGRGRRISQHEQALKASVRLPDKPIGSEVSSTRVQAASIKTSYLSPPGILFVYKRCCARAEKLSSVFGSEKARCRIKVQLPCGPVYKPGRPLRLGTSGLHACMQTVSSQGFIAMFCNAPSGREP